MPEPSSANRRRYPRFKGNDLVANIGGKLVKVLGISASGMKLEAGFKLAPEGVMRFTLYPVAGDRVDLNHGVAGTCRLVREEGGSVAMQFDPATYRLVRMVADYTALGHEED